MGSQDELKLIITAQDKTQQAILSTSNGLKYLEGSVTKLSIQVAALGSAWNQVMAVVQKAMHYIDLGAQAMKAEEAYGAMADSAEVNAGRLASAMKKAADGFVDDSHLMQKASFAMAQDIDPEKIPELFEAARVASRKTGQDVTFSIDGMIQAISTNMPRSLRQMGMITKEQMNLLNQAMAAGVDDVNLLDLVLANAAVDTAKLGASANNAAKDIARFKVQVEETKEALGKGLIVILQKLGGVFQGVAGFALSLAMNIFRVLQGISELAGKSDKAKYWGEQAAAAEGASNELYKRSIENMYGTQAPSDKRTKEQKDKDIAEAEARQKALLDDLRKKVAAAKGTEKAKRLQEEWEHLNRMMEADISAAGLEEFEKKLISIEKKAEELRAKEAVKKAPGGVAKVGLWAATMEEEAASEQAKKDFEERLKLEQDIEKYTKEQAGRLKAIREGEINEQLAELDIAEKLGTAHRDTIEERIRLSEELLDIQEQYLDSLDKEKDPASWYAQKNAIDNVRKSLAELYREQLMQDPFEAVKLSMKDLENEWSDTGKQMYNLAKETAQAMQSAYFDFLDVTGDKFLSFGELANSVLKGIYQAMLKVLTYQMAVSTLTGSGDLFSLLFSAKGNVFEGGKVVPFASGGFIVRKPTLFPMANGGVGLMGEAGTEAVVPLTRTSDGKLGVQSVGAGGNMNVTVNIENNTGQAIEAKQTGASVSGEDYVVTMAIRNITRNGALRTAIQGIRA